MQLSPGRRLIIGIFVLLLVDIIWVASSELTEFIFNESGFKKPFFSTYLKTSMFSLYLLGFCCWRPWRMQCLVRNINFYQVEVPADGALRHERSSLSEPSYEPLKVGGSEKASDAESDDSSIRSVRFSRITEVRQLSEEDGADAMLSRLSYPASQRAEQLAKESVNKFPIKVVATISLIFCFMWSGGNYAFQLGLSETEAAVVNVVSSSSSLFTLILAAFFPSSPRDKFSFSKLISAALMIVGITLISFEDLKLEHISLPLGVFWTLLSAILYSCYIVFLKWKVPSEENMDFTMFFGFVGLFNALLLWPGFLLLNACGLETFELPTKKQFVYLSLNGLIGTMLSELLWLWGCFLTSSLMATLSLSLTIPLTMVFDIVIKGIHYSWLFYLGSLPVLVSFVSVTLLTHYEGRDPLMDGLRCITKGCCSKHDYSPIALDVNERESLIVNHDEDNNCEEILLEDEINMPSSSYSAT